MNEKNIPAHPDCADCAKKAAPGRHFCGQCQGWRDAASAALNHPDAAGLFADADAVRAAREQGWDNAAEWAYRAGYLGHHASKRTRAANPYRPAPRTPGPGTVAAARAVIDAYDAWGASAAGTEEAAWAARDYAATARAYALTLARAVDAQTAIAKEARP